MPKKKSHGEVLSKAIEKGAFSDTFFSSHADCFFYVDEMGKQRKLTGINPVLREIFYSKYRFDRKMFNACMKKSGRKKSSRKKPPSGQSVIDGIEMNLGKELGPLARGSIVHNQLEILFSQKSNNIDLFEKKYGYIDDFTISACKWLKDNKLKPVKSELAISDPDLRIGTAIDLIAEDKNGELVLIEWKTGNPDTFKFYTGAMEGDLSKFMSNCPLNQAVLQLFTTYFIFKEKYFIPVKKLIVVHISNDFVEEHIYDAKKNHGFCSFIYEEIKYRRGVQ